MNKLTDLPRFAVGEKFVCNGVSFRAESIEPDRLILRLIDPSELSDRVTKMVGYLEDAYLVPGDSASAGKS